MSEKQIRTCKYLNYIEHLLILLQQLLVVTHILGMKNLFQYIIH